MTNQIPEQFAAANKAAVDALLTVANTALASAERVAALNLNTARAALPYMIDAGKGGRIISIGGDSSRIGEPNLSMAAATRAGAIALERRLKHLSENSELLEGATYEHAGHQDCSHHRQQQQ